MKYLFISGISLLFLLQACTFFQTPRQRALATFSDFDIASLDKNAGQMIEEGEPEVIHFPEISYGEDYDVPFDSVYEEVSIVKLETTEQSIVGNYSKISIVDDVLYILDDVRSKSLFRFSLDGKFIDKIGNVGQGPGEYTEPTDFYVLNGYVYIYDEFQNVILRYDKDGNYISSTRIPFLAFQVAQYDTLSYVFRSYNTMNPHFTSLDQCNMWVTDTSFNIIKSGMKYPVPTNTLAFDSDAMKRIGNEIICYEPFCDSLFVLDQEYNLQCKYSLDFGGHRKKSFYSSNDAARQSVKNPDFYNVFHCNMSSDFVDCVVALSGHTYLYLYSRTSKKVMVLKQVVFDNGSLAPRMCLGYTIWGGCYVECYNPLFMPQDSLTMSTWQKHIKGDFADIRPDDNPVLVFYKLRKW